MFENLLVSQEEMKENRRKTIGKLFIKYQEAIDKIKIIDWIKQEIGKKQEREIIVKFADISKELGPDFKKYKYGTLYEALKYIFFYNGLIINGGTHKDGDKVFLIREKRANEKLTPHYLELEKKADIVEERKKRREKEAEERRNEIQDRRNKRLYRKKDIDRKLIELEEKYQKIKAEKEELIIETQRQMQELKNEKKVLEEVREGLEDTKKFKQILEDKFVDNTYLAEIFQFNWKTLTWKLIKRKQIKNYTDLINMIIDNLSSIDNRYRFELTPIKEIENKGEIELK